MCAIQRLNISGTFNRLEHALSLVKPQQLRDIYASDWPLLRAVIEVADAGHTA
jgi:hypothetical protein